MVSSQNRVLLRLLSSRSLTSQFPVEVFKIFSQIRVQQLLPLFYPNSRFKRFFALFLEGQGHPAVECESARALQLIRAERYASRGLLHRRCWQHVDALGHWPMEVARSPHRRPPGAGVRVWLPSGMALTAAWSSWRTTWGCGWLLRVTSRQEWFWQVRCSSWSTFFPSGKRSSRWWWLSWVPSSHVSLGRLSEEFHYLRCFARCAVRTWKYGALPVAGCHFLCLGVACGVQGCGFVVRCASTEAVGRISHIFLGAVDSDPEASWSPCSCRMEKCAQSML